MIKLKVMSGSRQIMGQPNYIIQNQGFIIKSKKMNVAWVY